MDEGLPVYISRATVKGQRWMRLRVGFFTDRDSAMKAGKELQKILGQEDYWPVRIGPEETAEFAAYLK
jgi:cell division septation protein DedD